MEKAISKLLNKDEVTRLKDIANASKNYIASSESRFADYPPTKELNFILNSLVESIKTNNDKLPQDTSIFGLLYDTQYSCNHDLYGELEKLTLQYNKRVTKTSDTYKDLIVKPLMSQFFSNSSANNVDEIEGLIIQLRTRQKELNQEVKKATDSIEHQAQVHLSRIEREYKRTLTDLENGANKLESETHQKIENLASDTHIQLQTIANTQRNELAEQTAKQIDTAIETKRKAVFDQLESDSNQLLLNIKKDVDYLSSRIKDEINEFAMLNDSLRKTLSYISSDALADASIAQATIEKESADKLRIYGVSWLLLSIFLFITTFDYDALVDKTGVPQYTLILLRSFFLIVGSAPAFYLLRESARHRTDERRYRQKGIQLATIDGYLAEFDGEDRNSVKKELTKHYFHGGDHFVDASSVDSIQATYDKILDRVLGSGQAKKE